MDFRTECRTYCIPKDINYEDANKLVKNSVSLVLYMTDPKNS